MKNKIKMSGMVVAAVLTFSAIGYSEDADIYVCQKDPACIKQCENEYYTCYKTSCQRVCEMGWENTCSSCSAECHSQQTTCLANNCNGDAYCYPVN